MVSECADLKKYTEIEKPWRVDQGTAVGGDQQAQAVVVVVAASGECAAITVACIVHSCVSPFVFSECADLKKYTQGKQQQTSARAPFSSAPLTVRQDVAAQHDNQHDKTSPQPITVA